MNDPQLFDTSTISLYLDKREKHPLLAQSLMKRWLRSASASPTA